MFDPCCSYPMTTKRILVLSPFFYPEPISTGRYNLTMAEGLVAAEVEVFVACCHPFYPAWKPEPSDAQLPGMQIVRGGRYLRFPASAMLRRALLEVWFACFATWQARRLRNRIDTVVAVFPPSLFFLGVNFVMPSRIRRVGVIHDLQGVHAGASRSRLTRALVGVIGAIERRAFSACDRLIVLSAAMGRKLVETTGVDADRVTVVYPFVNLPQVDAAATRLVSLFPQAAVKLVYSGALGEKQNPAQLADIFEAIVRTCPDVAVNVFSEGPSFEWLKARMQERRVPRIAFHGLVPDQDVAELYHRADIQLIPQASGTQHGSMPSKLPNILASGRKVLALCDTDSELADVVAQFRAGISTASWAPDDVAAVVATLAADVHSPDAPRPDTLQIREFFSLARLIGPILGP